ncbi:MAG: hypothetical protein Q4D90_07365 [bacterium]|nr:hypothetical protein [bacterium]
MKKKSITLMLLFGVCLSLLAQVLASPLASVFVGYDAELFEMTHHAFRLFSFAFLLAGFNIFASSFFTALNNGIVSALISFLRTLIFQLSCVLILPLFLGIDGIWLAISVAELFAFVVSTFFLLTKQKQYGY